MIKKVPKVLLIFIAGAVSGLLLRAAVAGGIEIWAWQTKKTVWQSCQPPEVSYAPHGTYCVAVIEGNLKGLVFPEREYDLLIATHNGIKYGSGHYFFDYPFEGPKGERRQNIAKSQAQWSPEGAYFTDSDGRRLFFPKVLFVGGR